MAHYCPHGLACFCGADMSEAVFDTPVWCECTCVEEEEEEPYDVDEVFGSMNGDDDWED